MLLTSSGLANQNIINQFLQLINKPTPQIKIIFVPTASRTEHELMYMQESKKELLNLGILEANIKTLSLNQPISFSEIKDFDVIYVCGGNTFYLLKKVRESGFDEIIKEFIKTDKLYFGVSAGSILVGPNIEIAHPGDKNDVNLQNLTGLNLTNIIISPHYTDEEKSFIEGFKEKSPYPVVPLTNEQALLILDGKTKIVE